MPAPNLTLEEALDRILESVPAMIPEVVSVAQVSKRFLATPTAAKVSIPSFDNSAMDGYAVRSADTRMASAENPVLLKLSGRVEAGHVFVDEVRAGECVRIFTGSPMPRGADAVVMQEDTLNTPEKPEEVKILDGVKPWENMRLEGEDVRHGSLLGESGEPITPALMAILQATGVATISVGKRPMVGVMATGSELIEPGEPLPPGSIYESNRAMIAAMATNAGAQVRVMPLVKDSLIATTAALEEAFSESDIVITSGGVSVGEMDFVKPAFERMGGRLDFWKVAIKPGRPFVFGRFGNKFLMGLPGNPVSAFVTYLLLVRPALLRWQGAREINLPAESGILAESIHNDGKRRHFVRVRRDAQGLVHVGGVQASHVLSSLAAANGILDMPPESHWDKGRSVVVLRF